MRTICIISFFYMMTCSLVNAQSWITGNGGVTNDEALDVSSDSLGNFYAAGYFTGVASFGSNTLSASGNSDIFIAKYNAAGQVLWSKKAGGSGPDRAYSIYADPVGNLYVTGFYYGSANFDGTIINSVGNSQDVFIAKYTSTGTLVWVKSVGGSNAETGYGICADQSGNVVITGQFKGSANFGSTTLVSDISPNTGLASFDIFTLKLDPTGNVLWVKQGKAKYEDRGLDVAIDGNNNVFVVGQFSDTIQFDVVHNNSVMNAGYLIKYDANGIEQWMVKMSALQTLVNGIAIDGNNQVYITGDYKGNLGIFTSPMVFSTSNYTSKIFIAKFTNAGQVLWVQNDGSNNEVTSKSIALDKLGEPYISGMFKCRFDEYSEVYGSGIFYSSGYRDIFITKYSATGTRKWFKHFGSNKDDYNGGIAVKNIDKPIIAGSFENHFNAPYAPSFNTIINNNSGLVFYNNSNSYSNCNTNYQSFVGRPSHGYKDIYVTSPVDPLQGHFDYFQRYGNCNLDFLEPCINFCQDTVEACGVGDLFANPKEIDTNYIGATYHYLWNTGSTDFFISSTNSGNFWLKSVRDDGCFQNVDTIYLKVNPIPSAALISDSMFVNVNHPPFANSIEFCAPDSVVIWASNLIPSNVNAIDTNLWTSGNSFNLLNDSTISVSSTGLYTFVSTNEFGCSAENKIVVNVIDSIPDFPVIDPHIIFLDSTLNATDTISICLGEGIVAKVIDSAYLALNGGSVPYKDVKWHLSPTNVGGVYNFNSPFNFTVPTTGWYTLYDTIIGQSNQCSTDSTKIPISRPLYVIVKPLPIVNVNLTGPSNNCPYDSIMLYASGNVTNFNWQGPNIIQSYNDSAFVLSTNQFNQIYSVSASITDSITGCSSGSSANFSLTIKALPLITMNPTDGIVCPNDSVLLTSQAGAAYQWIGPNGDAIGFNQTINVSTPGYYHCLHTDFVGCVQTTNFVEVKEYNTPYLSIYPANQICMNGSATITANASSSALIHWLAPLSGNSVNQIVNSPGTYKCEITQCGITVLDSITVTQSNTPSFISAIDSSICIGDTLMLNGNSGMISYEWVGLSSNDPFLLVSDTGTYVLKTTDEYGCFGYSAPFTVTLKSDPTPPNAIDTIICAGQTVSLTASATGTIEWYASSNLNTILATGSSYTTPIITANTTYTIKNNDGLCKSEGTSVHVNVHTSSLAPSISGDTILCIGEDLSLTADSTNVNYSWTGPNGSMGSMQNFYIANVSELNQGYYTLHYSDNYCTGPVDSFYVNIHQLPTPHINGDSVIYLCQGNTATLSIDSTYTSYHWYPDNQNTQSILVDTAAYYYAEVSQNGCTGVSNMIQVMMNNPLLNPVVSDTTVCFHSNVTIHANGSANLFWYDENMNVIQNGANLTLTNVDSTRYLSVQSVDTNGCMSNLVSAIVYVIQNNSAPIIYVDTNVCIGENIYLATDSLPGATYTWTGPNSFSASISSPTIYNVNSTNQGLYSLVVSINGCQTPVGHQFVNVHALPNLPTIYGDTVYCEGDTLNLFVTNNANSNFVWTSPNGFYQSSNHNIQIYPVSQYESGNFSFQINENGCTKDTLISISIKTKPTSFTYTNGPVCIGDSLAVYTDSLVGYLFHWTGPNNFSSNSSINSFPNASLLQSGTYSLYTELNGCVSDTTQILVEVIEHPVIDLGVDTAFCVNNQFTINLPPNYNYVWSDGSVTNSFTVIDSGLVVVTASIGPNCMVTDSIYIAEYNCLANTPNIITPNGDGINDVLFFNMEGMKAIKCYVFNRWGEEVYSWEEINGSWDGKSRLGDFVKEGVYFYKVEILDINNQIQNYSGFVHVAY